jgi:hypothetical protein
VHTAADDAQALLILTMIAGLAIGAVAVSRASGALRWVLLGALLSAELSAAWMTFERTLEARDARNAVARVQTAALISAEARVADAKAGVEAASEAINQQAALKGCAANCRALLQSAVDSARADYDEAQSHLASLPRPVEVQSVADVTGVEAWKLSAALALLVSLGTNVAGAALIAFAVHAAPVKVVERRVLDMDWQPKLKVAEQPNEVTSFQPLPPKPRRKRKQLPDNVLNFQQHKVIKALQSESKPVSNARLAELLGETEGEASKSWREVAEFLSVGKHGRELRIALRA